MIAVGEGRLLSEEARAVLKTETFDRDPGWEGRNNRLVPEEIPSVTQDFGYSRTHFAGKETGEMGGRIWRTTKPAHYAAKIGPKTLRDKLTASGTFAFTASGGSSGLFFGWFNSHQPGGSRPVGSLGMNFDGEAHGLRLAVRLITASNKSCGTFITPFVPGKFRPTPIRNDGARYFWTLAYDPEANSGKGRFEFNIKSNADKHETFEGKTFTVDLPEGCKEDGAVFDRFGMMNMGKPGNPLTVYFDDLQYDGKTQDFSTDPGWDGVGNRVTYQPEDVRGAHNYGYSAKTSFAGGAPGEIGGLLWRTEKNFGWYADRVGPLSLDDRLEAGGRVMLAIGSPDSDACFGWFNSESSNEDKPADRASFVGIAIGGPTRVGHYFRPQCVTAKGARRLAQSGPVIVPGRLYEWSLLYDPAGNNGLGSMKVALGSDSVTLDLKRGDKSQNAWLDRFGIVSTRPGGSIVKIWFDDLKYTAARAAK